MLRRLAALAAGVVLLVGAAPAGARDLPTIVQRGNDYLESVLQTPIPDRPVTMSLFAHDEGGPGVFVPDGCAWSDHIEVLPWVVTQLLRGHGKERAEAAYVLEHETLHRLQEDGPREEGVTDALTWDLQLGYYRALGFHGRMIQAGYAEEVQQVRWTSARATGEGWRTRPARLFRRELWKATPQGRDALAKAAWGN
jgi:hypothetical protein